MFKMQIILILNCGGVIKTMQTDRLSTDHEL
jgi:hypothetical protein